MYNLFSVPTVDTDRWKQPLPNGLIIMPNILSLEEEETFIQMIGSWSEDGNENDMLNESSRQTLKHRQVKHFGYEFVYGNNNVDTNKPLLNRQIPNECDLLWTRLREKYGDLIPFAKGPDQLTVNKYQPGQGMSANSINYYMMLSHIHCSLTVRHPIAL